MTPNEREAERLHEAVEAAAQEGAGTRALLPDLPADLAPLVGVAGQLAESGRLAAGEPRPSFVLALEEQLRCDLRLDLTSARRPTPTPHAAALGVVIAVAVLVLGALGLGLAIDRAGPDQVLSRWQPTLHALQVALSPSSPHTSELLLAQGWRHLDTLRRLAAAGQLSESELERLLANIGTAYEGALRHAQESGDERVALQAVREVRDAVGVLEKVAQGLGAPEDALLEAASEALQAQIRRFMPGVAAGLPAASPTPSFPPPTEMGPTAWPTGAVSVLVTITSPPSVTSVPPTATPLAATPTAQEPTVPAPASSTPTPLPITPPPDPPARERTPTPPPTGIPATPVVGPAPDTPTPDAWPTRTPVVEPTQEPTVGPSPPWPTAQGP